MANLELVVKESSNSHVTPQGQLCVLTWCAPLVFPASLSGMFPQVPGMLSGFVSPALCAWWCLLRSICPAMFAWFCMPGMYALHSAPGFGCPALCAQYRASATVCRVCMPGTRAQGFVPGVVPALCVLCCVCLALQAQFCGLGMCAQNYTSHSMCLALHCMSGMVLLGFGPSIVFLALCCQNFVFAGCAWHCVLVIVAL